MSTEIPEPAHRAPAADQPDGLGPADPDARPVGPGDAWQQQPPSQPAPSGRRKGLIRSVLRDLAALLAVAAVSALLGLAVGALWVWLAPTAQGTLTQGGVYYTAPESKQFIGQDGTLGIICAVTGLVLGVAAYLLTNRRGSVGAVVGLAGGGLLGGYLATIAAGEFGPGGGKTIEQMIVGMPNNTVFALPLQLRAVGMIWFWPLAAILVYLLMVTFFGPLDPVAPPQPQWGPQAWPQPQPQQSRPYPEGPAWPGEPEGAEQPSPYQDGTAQLYGDGPAQRPVAPQQQPPQQPSEPEPEPEPGTGTVTDPGTGAVSPDSALGPDQVDRRQ